MFRNEQDNQNTKYRRFQPFLFTSCTIVVVLLLLTSIYLISKPRRIIHTINHLKLQVLRISLEDAQKPPWKTFLVKPGDNLKKVFDRAGIDQSTYYKIVNLKDAQSFFISLRPKQAFYLLFGANHQLKKLILRVDKSKYLQLIQNKKKWLATFIKLQLDKKIKFVDGIIQQSFNQATEQYGVPKQIAANLTTIFSGRIDFAKQIRLHDKFKIIYEEYYAGKKEAKPGNIIAAELINNNKSLYAICYHNSDGSSGYYTPNGKNLRLAFMRAPVRYTRISSPFGARRMHPILHIVRPHQGVDLAAPRGTPIKASGDGVITFRGRKGGYGKVVIIKHNRKYATLYAHMSRFASHLHVGSRVRRGKVIGYVGMTGLATGPHLHYEFHVYGVPHDPMKVRLPEARAIPRKERKTFLAYAEKMVKKLDNIKSKN